MTKSFYCWQTVKSVIYRSMNPNALTIGLTFVIDAAMDSDQLFSFPLKKKSNASQHYNSLNCRITNLQSYQSSLENLAIGRYKTDQRISMFTSGDKRKWKYFLCITTFGHLLIPQIIPQLHGLVPAIRCITLTAISNDDVRSDCKINFKHFDRWRVCCKMKKKTNWKKH